MFAKLGEMNSRLAEAIDGIEVVKGSAQEDSEIEGFEQMQPIIETHLSAGDVESRFYRCFSLGSPWALVYFTV